MEELLIASTRHPQSSLHLTLAAPRLQGGKRVSVSRRDGNVAGKCGLFPALSEVKRLDESLNEQKCSDEHYLTE